VTGRTRWRSRTSPLSRGPSRSLPKASCRSGCMKRYPEHTTRSPDRPHWTGLHRHRSARALPRKPETQIDSETQTGPAAQSRMRTLGTTAAAPAAAELAGNARGTNASLQPGREEERQRSPAILAPISCLLTATSLHDSQAAILLASITAQQVTSLYDLMDCAYDATGIHAHSRSLGHVPLIAPHGSVPPAPVVCRRACVVTTTKGQTAQTIRPKTASVHAR